MKYVQPLKIILINSANCHYAEFDLSDSVHLVALNNRGKTSIINTLQFLYIDNYKELDMGHSLDETWKHYFPEQGSYVLFELNTLIGCKVFGLAATGMGAQPEKFLLDAAYDLKDFLIKTGEIYTPRKPENLFPLLGSKLRKRGLDAKQHRDLLKPMQVKHNPDGLGIIGDTNDYTLFKRLFRQLLQLKNITIKDLKDQIEQVNQRLMERSQVLNIQREYSEPYAEIQKRNHELERLRANTISISDLLELNKKQKNLRGRLCSYFLKADSLFETEDQQLQNAIATLFDNKKRLEKNDLPRLRLNREEKNHEISRLNQELGAANAFIKHHKNMEQFCQNIVIELELEALNNLEIEVKSIEKQIYQVEDTDSSTLKEKLQLTQQTLERYQVQLEQMSYTLFAYITPLLNIWQQEKLYRITNSELWGLFAGKEFELQDQKVFQNFLQEILSTDDATQLSLPGLRLTLSNLSVKGLYDLGNPDFLHGQIKEIKEDIEKIQQKIITVDKKDQLKNQLIYLRKQIKICDTNVLQYQNWQLERPHYQENLKTQRMLIAQIEECQSEVEQIERQITAINAEIQQYEYKIEQITGKRKTLNDQKKWIEAHPPHPDWMIIEVNYKTLLLVELYEQYQKCYTELQTKNSEIQRKLVQLRTMFPQLAGLQDDAAMHYLHEQLDAIPEKEKSINDQWKGIFTSFSAHCRGMIDSVEIIDNYLVDLNRLLGKQQISNLQSIKILLQPNLWRSRIYKIQEWRENDLPLFGGFDNELGEKLQQEIKPLLDKGKITISDLYDLKLLIIDSNNQEKQYHSLNLESNGTSITVKIIIFISMINKAMEGKQRLGENIRIPFYVDEIDSLDDVNAKNIHDTAKKLGLIPVFASPKGSGICQRLYQLDSNQYGKLNIRQKEAGKLRLLKPTFERLDII